MDDAQVAEFASLLEIDVSEARDVLTEVGGDFAAAIDALQGRRAKELGVPAAEGSGSRRHQEHRYEWPGGASVLRLDFSHELTGEPPLREPGGAGELRSLAKVVPPTEFLPVLCAVARLRATGGGWAAKTGLAAALLNRQQSETLSLSDLSLHSSSFVWPTTPALGRAASELAEPMPEREAAIMEGERRLQERLKKVGLQSVQALDDGNCLFRACGAQLYGHSGGEEHHLLVRHRAVAEMWEHWERYSAFFCSRDEFADYLADMAAPASWGDELVLRAIADSYCATVHVVTSNTENWYLVYSPSCGAAGGAARQAAEASGRGRHIFLTYLAPVHYNGFEEKPVEPGDVKVDVRVRD